MIYKNTTKAPKQGSRIPTIEQKDGGYDNTSTPTSVGTTANTDGWSEEVGEGICDGTLNNGSTANNPRWVIVERHDNDVGLYPIKASGNHIESRIRTPKLHL